MTDLRESRFYDLLPPNLRTGHAAALSSALDRQMRALADHISLVYLFALIEELDEKRCDQLALNHDIQEYRMDMPLSVKREMILFTFQVSARRGTAWAVERLIKTIFGSAQTAEWFRYGGKPYYFRVTSEDIPKTIEEMGDFWSAVYETKNLRSWLESVSFTRRDEGIVYAAGASHQLIHGSIPLEYVEPDTPATTVWVTGIPHRYLSYSTGGIENAPND